jgi:ParB-like nuclease domain
MNTCPKLPQLHSPNTSCLRTTEAKKVERQRKDLWSTTALRLDPKVRDPIPYYMLMLDRVRVAESRPDGEALDAIVVRPWRDDCFRIVGGHHRVAASRDLGFSHIPALVETVW